MEGQNPAQLPVVQQTQAQPPFGQPVVSQQQQVPPGQPIMYQMAPGQQQPAFIQVPAGQPATTPEGQPIQYYYVPVGQSVQPGQPAQPGQSVFVQGAPGQPVQPGQQVFVQGVPGQPVQPQQQAGQGGFELNIDTVFLKSRLCFIKIAEFVTLLVAWASILKYLDWGSGVPNFEDDKADFFKGIMIFSWVVVILYLIIYTLSFPKICNCKRPSMFTISSVVFYFILFALLLACTGNLVPRAVDLGAIFKLPPSTGKDTIMLYIIALDVALAFGFLSCILFVVDMVLNYRLFQTQRAQETPSDQGPQRRVWDIDQEYLRSPVFYVKLVEVGLLFGAWVCILKYFDMDIIKRAQTAQGQSNLDLSKEEFFRGITIFSWVMVILLALTFVFSFGKICSRSSPWTLATFLFYIFLSILLIACCGNLTSLAIEYGKVYRAVPTSRKPNVLALFIGLGFGYIAWITFIVDICLLYKWYQQQRMQEFPPQQASQQVVQQPAVVIMPSNMAHPGQQSVQYPGQQPVVIGVPPPGYSAQPQQDMTRK